MSDAQDPKATQQKVPHLLLGGFVTDTDYTYDAVDAQYCLAMATELGLLKEYVFTLADEESADPSIDLIQVMATPAWLARWVEQKKIPELKMQLDSLIIGSEAYKLLDIALDNARYLLDRMKACGILSKHVQDQADDQTHTMLVDGF